MSRRLQIEWQETAEDLKRIYHQDKHSQRRDRLMSFWHLCEGKQMKEVAEMIGTDVSIIQKWLAWYRTG